MPTTQGQRTQLQFLQNMSTYLIYLLWRLHFKSNYLFDHSRNADCLKPHIT